MNERKKYNIKYNTDVKKDTRTTNQMAKNNMQMRASIISINLILNYILTSTSKQIKR